MAGVNVFQAKTYLCFRHIKRWFPTHQTESLELRDGFYVLEYSASEMSDATWYISLQDSANFITFADEKVKEICLANWDTNQDGGLSYAEAAAVTSLDKVFKDKAEITSFDELRFFTGIKSFRQHFRPVRADGSRRLQGCLHCQGLDHERLQGRHR